MDTKELRRAMLKITTDLTRSLESRVEEAFALREKDSFDSPDEKLCHDVIIYTDLIDMMVAENNDHQHDADLLMLYTMLAETYADQYKYAPMRKIASEALDIMREEKVGPEDYKIIIPRLAEALENSVYRHALLEILLIYLREALKDNSADSDLKPEAERMLRLYVILERDSYLDRLFDKNMESALSSLFSSSELMDIIRHPLKRGLRVDPVEFTYRWEDIYDKVEEELDRRFADTRRGMGFCHILWNAKRDLLKEKYGIDWKSPAVMNPHVHFD